LGVFLVCALLFSVILFQYHRSDIPAHAYSAKYAVDGVASYRANFLYYFVINLLSWFSGNITALFVASIIVLSASITAKLIITEAIFREYLSMNGVDVEIRKNSIIILVAAVCSLIIFPIPNPYIFYKDYYYLGQIVSNVWHNSTTIFLVPFALMLFWKQYQLIENKDDNNILPITILVVINILIKPSFFFVYSVVSLFLLFTRYRISREFFIKIVPIVIGFVLVAIQYYLIYKLNLGYVRTSGVVVAPFLVWKTYIPLGYIPFAVLTSFLFPIAYFSLYEFKLDLLRRYSVYLVIASVLIFILLAETGIRLLHGNFYWQNVISTYILMMVLLIETIRQFLKRDNKNKLKTKILLLVYGVYVISGIVYLFRLVIKGYFS